MNEIKLEPGQTWLDDVGTKRRIAYIENDWVFYCFEENGNYHTETKQEFSKMAYELQPKTVRKSQCLIKYGVDFDCEDFAGFFATEEDAKAYCKKHDYVFKQWPLVVNGVEQWVEVNCD